MIELEAELLAKLENVKRQTRDGTDEEVNDSIDDFNHSLSKQRLLSNAIAGKIENADHRAAILEV